ncbi:Glutathionylspermidine synthase [Pseudomonas syringae pv. actinidiae]|uniref:Glutathionylspermidine synthase n=1 Tax=Pseudomonas syringae pv. actinidiae TaxID=103796 RepID=A0AAN4QA24_PSESF|nr:Glutathionylspermidine synthase [Pseudomonas syringae pv. actinidiae]
MFFGFRFRRTTTRQKQQQQGQNQQRSTADQPQQYRVVEHLLQHVVIFGSGHRLNGQWLIRRRCCNLGSTCRQCVFRGDFASRLDRSTIGIDQRSRHCRIGRGRSVRGCLGCCHRRNRCSGGLHFGQLTVFQLDQTL